MDYSRVPATSVSASPLGSINLHAAGAGCFANCQYAAPTVSQRYFHNPFEQIRNSPQFNACFSTTRSVFASAGHNRPRLLSPHTGLSCPKAVIASRRIEAIRIMLFSMRAPLR